MVKEEEKTAKAPAAKKKAAPKKKAAAKKKATKKKAAAKKKKKKPNKKLVIVESPTKAKTINRYLGSNYEVVACMGHVRDLPKSRLGVDVEKDFEPHYVTLRGKNIGDLRKKASKASMVYLAPDPDREGEAIAWHLMEALRLPIEKVKRVTFNEVTKAAVKDAFSNPYEINMSMVNAQQARRILDRLVGYQVSPILWKKIAYGLSAGRVQSVAVRLIMEREREIRAFVPEEFWEIDATLRRHENEGEFEAKFRKHKGKDLKVTSETQATEIVSTIEKGEWRVSSVEKKEVKGHPQPPFITSTIQQAAANQLGFQARRTMRVAQELYEGVSLPSEGRQGLITYMRTDSIRMSDDAIESAREYINENFGEKYLPEKPNEFKVSKRAQGGHEAIRPSVLSRSPDAIKDSLSRDQFRLYNLIWRRAIASQMPPARFHATSTDIDVESYLFRSTWRVQIFDGHLKVWDISKNAKDKAFKEPPLLDKDDLLKLLKLDPTQHFTQPPARYTEASIVRTLEKGGIGRPSTYATIVSTIVDRGYVRREKKQFFCTELGEMVIDRLLEHFKDIMEVGFTSKMESELDRIAEENLDWVKVLSDFYGPFKIALEEAQENMGGVKGDDAETRDIDCPQCGKNPMVVKWSRRGRFLGCSEYPECTGMVRLKEDGSIDDAPGAQGPEITEEDCDFCTGKLMLRRDRFSRTFFGCQHYPECSCTAPADRETGKPMRTTIICEECNGPMVVRLSRRGPFLGCAAYPKCKGTASLPKEHDFTKGHALKLEPGEALRTLSTAFTEDSEDDKKEDKGKKKTKAKKK